MRETFTAGVVSSSRRGAFVSGLGVDEETLGSCRSSETISENMRYFRPSMKDASV